MSNHTLTAMNELSRELRAEAPAHMTMTANLIDSVLRFLRETDPVKFPAPETALEESSRLRREWHADGVSPRAIRARLKTRGLP